MHTSTNRAGEHYTAGTGLPSKDFLRPHRKGCTITIEAMPGSDRTEIAGVNEWRGALAVKVAAEARGGEANDELLSFLADRLGVSKGSVRIVKGERSSHKVLFVPLSEERLRTALEEG